MAVRKQEKRMQKSTLPMCVIVIVSFVMFASTEAAQYGYGEPFALGLQMMAPGSSSTISETAADERDLAIRVEKALATDKNLAELGLVARATDGNVALSGIAERYSQAARAVAIARTVTGVKRVTNEIRVN
jgi:osmotically-inducible protein OsmY